MTLTEIPGFAEFTAGEHFELPPRWNQQIRAVAKKYASTVESPPTSSTSAASGSEDQLPLKYSVVDGGIVRERLNWLDAFYRGAFLELAQTCLASSKRVVVSQNVVTGVNLNIMRGASDSYEWHYDSNPLTGLLFVTAHRPGDGGELIFDINGEQRAIHPVPGTLIFFDARNTRHTVRSLASSKALRISAPMNYYLQGETYTRPTDLDHHMFGRR